MGQNTYTVSDPIDAAEQIYELEDGESIRIRRADYLDTEFPEEVISERPKLTLIKGGKQ